jgi:hypothetical protein
MHWNYWGLGLAIVGVGVTVSGITSHPVIGIAMMLVGVAVCLWPAVVASGWQLRSPIVHASSIDVRKRIHGQVITSTGLAGPATTCVVNGASLADFRDDYNFAIVSGLNDTQADKFEDPRIAVSKALTILPTPIEVLIPDSEGMIAVARAEIEGAKESFTAANPDIPKGTPIFIPFSVNKWSEVILLPKGINSSEIRRLSDVRRYRGLVVSQEVLEGRVVATP